MTIQPPDGDKTLKIYFSEGKVDFADKSVDTPLRAVLEKVGEQLKDAGVTKATIKVRPDGVHRSIKVKSEPKRKEAKRVGKTATLVLARTARGLAFRTDVDEATSDRARCLREVFDLNSQISIVNARREKKQISKNDAIVQNTALTNQLSDAKARFKSADAKLEIVKGNGVLLEQKGGGTQERVSDKPQHRKKKWDKYNEIVTGFVDQLPDIKFARNNLSNSKPRKKDYNNYGFTPDAEGVTTIEVDGVKMVSGFTWNNNTYTLANDPKKGMLYQLDNNGQLFHPGAAGSAIYHDRVEVSDSDSKGKIITLCDGCGHSNGAAKAAEIAASTAQAWVADGIAGCQTLKELAQLSLGALKAAQITLHADHAFEGDTTFVQACIKDGIATGVVVGDSKVFVLESQGSGKWRVRDISGLPQGKTSVSDSGGYLSASNDTTDDYQQVPRPPNLAQMRVFAARLPPGAFLYVCSDGVSDCFDPSHLRSKPPSDFDPQSTDNAWDLENHPEQVKIAETGVCINLAEVLKGCSTEKEVLAKIISHLAEVTAEEKVLKLTGQKTRHQPGWGKADDAAMAITRP
jgi:serine/threonine protein phosphatase PrpC